MSTEAVVNAVYKVVIGPEYWQNQESTGKCKYCFRGGLLSGVEREREDEGFVKVGSKAGVAPSWSKNLCLN